VRPVGFHAHGPIDVPYINPIIIDTGSMQLNLEFKTRDEFIRIDKGTGEGVSTNESEFVELLQTQPQKNDPKRRRKPRSRFC
jgi:hypothetical protein